MKLFSSATSPYVRKILVMLRECGKLEGIEMTPSAGSPLDSSKMPIKHNPLGKIPALLTDQGQALYDSRVITRYLDQHFTTGLYPSDATLWGVLTTEAMADGILDAAILMVYEARVRPEDKRFAPWVEGQWSKVTRALDALEADISALNGPLNMAQIAIGCALSYLDFRHDARDWRKGRSKLAAWEAEFAKRPSMLATVPAE